MGERITPGLMLNGHGDRIVCAGFGSLATTPLERDMFDALRSAAVEIEALQADAKRLEAALRCVRLWLPPPPSDIHAFVDEVLRPRPEVP